MVDAAVDFLIHKDLGAAAQYFNRTGRSIFNRRQVTNAVYTFMSKKEQQRHLTDLTIREEDHDHAEPVPGSIPACHLADDSTMTPDEHAVRSDARSAFDTISAAIGSCCSVGIVSTSRLHRWWMTLIPLLALIAMVCLTRGICA